MLDYRSVAKKIVHPRCFFVSSLSFRPFVGRNPGGFSRIEERKLVANQLSFPRNFGSSTLPETNELPMKIPIFPGKYYQNGGFSMAMLVSGRVALKTDFLCRS